MVPAASHPNYGRVPKAVRILDRSLREVATGSWVTHASISPGRYQATVLLDSPRMAVCFSVDVQGPSTPEETPPKYVFASLQDGVIELPAGNTHSLSFELKDPEGDGPAPDEITALIYRLPGTHQWRPEVENTGQGRYAVDFTPRVPGRYRFVVGVPGHGIQPGDLAPVDLLISGLPDDLKGNTP